MTEPPQRRLPGKLNFVITWASFLVRLAGQLGYFLLIARALGPHDYGMVATVIALLLIAAAFSGWGSDHILIRHVTAAPERFGPYFGNALIQTVATALPLALLVYVAQSVTVGMAPLAFVAFAASELLFVRLHGLVVCCFMAFERGVDLVVVNSAFGLLRLASCAAAIIVSAPLDIDAWAAWNLGGAAVTGLLAIGYAIWRLGRPRWYFARDELALGFHFCLYFASDNAVRDIDKPMVAYLAGPFVAGIYNAAFRIVDAAALPLRAMTASFYARFFKHGHEGIERSFRFALKVLPLTLGYTAIAGLILTFGADYLPLILGEKFRAAAPVASCLAFLPVFNGLSAIGGDVLTSTGRQRSRAFVMAGLSVAPVLWCLLLVPRFGAVGAAYASLGNAALVAAAIWSMVLLSRRRAARALAPATAPAE